MNENIQILAQLIEAMNDATTKLERSFNNKKLEEFKKIKLEILELQKKISSIIK